MMEYLIANFESFANTYVTVLIEIYLFLVTILLACWLKPFMDNGKAAYVSVTAYYILGVINNHTGTGKDVDRILVIGIIAVGIVAAWLLDGRRNPIDHKVTVNDEGLPDSSKHESGHGYGLRNIKSIAGKYKGDIEIRQKESDGMLYFILNIMLMGK